MIFRLLFLFLLIPQIVFAADWYCDYTNGDDSTGDGSSGSPYKTFQKCVDEASRGDNIFLANTSAQVLDKNFSIASYTSSGSGLLTVQSWDNGGSITIQRPDEASARVAAIIDGADTYTLATMANVAFKNIKFQNFATVTSISNNSIVSGCELTSLSNTGGQSFFMGSDSVFENNYIHNNDGADAVSVQYRTVVLNNWFENNDPYTVFSNRSTLKAIRDRNIVVGNIFINNGYRSDIETDFNGQYIVNNTFVSLGEANQKGIFDPEIESVILNNIFFNYDASGAIPIDSTGSHQFMVGYNAFYDSNSPTYSSIIGLDLTANDITGTGNPFVDSINDDYCVTGSDAEDAAYGGNLLDIGALECTASGGGGGSTMFVPIGD